MQRFMHIAHQEALQDIKNLISKTKNTLKMDPLPVSRVNAPGKKSTRKLFDTHLLPNYSAFEVQRALFNNDRETAWKIYKLKTRDWQDFHPDDHTSILGSLTTFNSPLSAAAHASRVKYNMRNLGISMDERDYVFLLTIHLRNRNDVARVAECFQESISIDNIEPSIQMYCILLKSLSLAKQLKRCIQVYDEMIKLKRFAIYDLESRAILLEAHARSGDLSGAESMFKDYKLNIEPVQNLKMGQDIVIYNAMIRSFGFNRELDRANKIFKSLGLNGKPQATLDTFDAMLDAHLQCDFADALDFWVKYNQWCIHQTISMLSAASRTDQISRVSTHNFALPAWSKHSKDLLSPPSISNSFIPRRSNSIMYPLPSSYLKMMKIAIADLKIKNNSFKHVLAFFHLCHSLYPPLSAEFYECVIESLVSADEIRHAEIWYEAMINAHHRPSFHINQIMHKQ